MRDRKQRVLDSEKLLRNALDSICLGVEDYHMSIDPTGNPVRAISAARNLYAGVLLLFKYKVAVAAGSPEKAALLIYKTKGFQARINGEGSVDAVLQQENRTVDVRDLQDLFKALRISTDWGIVASLQTCRNDLEHLHAQHPMEDINRFLIALFPLLKDFMINEMGANPYELLGSTWEEMLLNHEFHTKTLAEARAKWRVLGVLEHTMELFQSCLCRACGSALLEPNRDDVASKLRFDDSEFRCSCMACGQSDSFTERLAEELRYAKEDPFDDTALIIECENCWHPTFDLTQGICHLCTYEQVPLKCSDCGTYLTDHTSLCDRCEEADHQMRLYEEEVRSRRGEG